MIKKNKILYAVLIYITFVVLSIGFISACDLQIIKSSDKSIAEPGEVITFTLIYENVGEGNCTGGGVKIQDVLEDKLEYNGNYNIDIINDFDDEGVYYGWQGIPGFNETSKTLTWNAHIVSPGERGEITFEAIVLEGEEECVDFEVSNFFSSWSDQEGWKDSNTITINVKDECYSPECGNNFLDEGEECDDGNIVNGDGCSSVCQIEEDEEDCPCPGCYMDNYKPCSSGCAMICEYECDCGCGDNQNEEEEDSCDDDKDCDKDKKSIKVQQFCETNWVCSGWSECVNGFMTRECVDKNNCEESYGIPSEQSPCVDKVISTSYVLDENRGISIWVVAGGIVAIILIIILVLLIG